MFTIDLNHLMGDEEIEDALKSYCTDPTPERKLRVLSEIAHCISGMTDAEIDITGTEDIALTGQGSDSYEEDEEEDEEEEQGFDSFEETEEKEKEKDKQGSDFYEMEDMEKDYD